MNFKKLTNFSEWPRLQRISAAVVGTLAVGALLAVLVAAVWPESSAEAKKNFCNSLSDFSAAVANYQGLNPQTATSEQVDAAASDVTDAWNNVVDDAEDWANAYDNPLGLAYDDLYWQIQFMPDDYTVAESLNAVSDELAAFPSAFHETFDGSGCTTATA